MFDFETLIDRAGTGAGKWVRRSEAEVALNIVPMSVADMELPVAPCVRDAVVRAAEHGIYGYTDPTPAYYEAVTNWMRSRHAIALKPTDVVPISGVVAAMSVAIRAFSRVGDGVIVQSPVYFPFYSSIELNGRHIERCPLVRDAQGYRMDYEALEAAASKPDTTLFLLCSPHNPVGRVWTREELITAYDICKRHDVLVIADEIHADLIMEGRHVSFSNLSVDARLGSVTLTAPSKTFNVPGLQNANALIFDDGLRAAFKRQLKTDGFDNISYFGHAASIAAYTDGAPWLDAVIAHVKGNYAVLDAFLKAHLPMVKLYPMQGTYLAWVDFRALGLDVRALERFMREEAHLILSEGYTFGEEGAGFERFNLALPRAELNKALERLREAAVRVLHVTQPA